MLDTLFGLIPAASRGQQWLAEDLQLVNWGGYDGPHRIRFSPTATLLCGGSGTGKSTLMDAYIALMMPHTTPFNGASNGGVVGRPRGHEQRNIISYGRGKLDESRSEDGTKMRVLRGDRSDTWAAVAMTWVERDGSRFTAVRAWYIPAAARVVDDTVRVRATIEGAFDLGQLEPAAVQHLSDAAVSATGLSTLATDREFSARLHATLGIGAAGAGSKAMSLLARIQSGQQITTVDELYKRMVLEDPQSLATTDAVVQHFDELEATRLRMVTARQQIDALTPIRSVRRKIEDSAARMRLVDEVGQFSAPTSLAALWRADRRRALLRDVETELRDRKRKVDQEVGEREALAKAAEAERDGLLDVLAASGGDRLATAKRELRTVEDQLDRVRLARQRVDDALSAVQAEVSTAKQFAAISEVARQAIGNPDTKAAARDAYAAAAGARRDFEREVDGLEAELRRAEARQDNIPAELTNARDLLAQAAGLIPEELPFVGELVEVRTEFEPWREAFNLALGGFATTVLIDVAHLSAFRAAINAVRTSARVRFEGVPTGRAPIGLDERTLPGRLDFRNTGFTGWLQDRLDKRFGFVCVDSSEELDLHPKALTITGQLSEGDRGAHGGHGRANVLGFSNQRRLADIAAALGGAARRLTEATEALTYAEAALDSVDEQQAAYRTILDFTWEQVDIRTVEAEHDRWAGVIDEVAASNPEISRIVAQIAEAKRKVELFREAVGGSKTKQQQAEERWAQIVEEVDAVERTLTDAEDAERCLTEDQATYLDDRFRLLGAESSVSPTTVLNRFDAALATAAQRLASDQADAQQTLGEERDNLRRILTGFLERWPNPNLLPDPDQSVSDFERILAELEASGLHELQTEWRNNLVKLSGDDLADLDSTLARSLREIRERIEPINQIMRDLPFYDDDHRLQITIRESQSAVRQRFRKELRDVRALVENAHTNEEREQVYERMARLIRRIRRTAPDFADLIDVRNHVRVSAERIDADTQQHVALYDHIGEKSGGESQELIAFIVGAALRYQLGDAGAQRPRYAPVFLDEALIKADAHFTKRAIGAWRGLGFQLIVGAPNDKYSAIEPHVDVEYDILKDTRGRSWAKPKIGLQEQHG